MNIKTKCITIFILLFFHYNSICSQSNTYTNNSWCGGISLFQDNQLNESPQESATTIMTDDKKPSAVVNKVWVEPYQYNDGKFRWGIKIHVNLDVYGTKRDRVKVIAYLYDSEKNKLMKKKINPLVKMAYSDIIALYDEGYCTTDNQVCVSENDKLTYDNTHWDNFVLTLPTSALAPACKSDHNDYYVKVRVIDKKSGEFISNNEPYEKFHFFGENIFYGICCTPPLGDDLGSISFATAESYPDFFKCKTKYESGWEINVELSPCTFCEKTGKFQCSVCFGTMMVPSYGTMIPCPRCGMTGKEKCSMCSGHGCRANVVAINDRLGTKYVNGKFESFEPNKNPSQNIQPSPVAKQPSSTWTGTGFAVLEGYIVTNYHVVNNAKTIKVYGTKSVFNEAVEAQVIATDKVNDLALIKIKGYVPQQTLPYSIKTQLSDVGEEIFVLGYPLTSTMGDEIKLTTGIISARSGFEGDVALYQISAPIQPGNSGGPLFDKKGNLIGVVSSKHVGAENVGYAIKASYLKNLIESAIGHDILPHTNTIYSKDLAQQVKAVKNHIYYIMCTD